MVFRLEGIVGIVGQIGIVALESPVSLVAIPGVVGLVALEGLLWHNFPFNLKTIMGMSCLALSPLSRYH